MRGEKGRAFGRWLGSILLPAMVSGLAACGGGGGPTSPSAPPPPRYAGTWSGQTSEGDALTFMVAGSQVTSLTLDFTAIYLVPVGSGGVLAVLCKVNLRATGPISISGTSFDIPLESSVGKTALHGSFSSETTASGGVDAFTLTGGCSGESNIIGADQSGSTWRATK